jgi:tRNA pseudouridine38-40 synthase
MTNWKLTLAYDGTPYRGWQIQPGLPTVQGLLSDAIHRTTGVRVLPQGSGRTDAGVHALAQVASFTLAAPIPAASLHRALNRCLPPSVRVLAVEAVPPSFHARHSALRKTYEYRIFPLKPNSASNCHSERSEESPHFDRTDDSTHDRICPPTLAPTVWPCPWPLSLDLLNRAAAHVLGTHDFTSFAAVDPDLAHRTMNEDCHSERSEESPHLSSCSPGAPSYPVSSDRVGYSRPAPGAPFIAPLSHAMSGSAASEPIRTITHSQWRAADGLLIYRVTANGFLHHMVRNLVGAFVQCGAHRLDPAAIPALLAARNRALAGPTAPASGLFLVSVDYPGPVNPLDPPN